MKPGKIIRSYRTKLGLNQKKLAELSRIPRSTLCRIEQDQHASVNTDTMRKIAKVLGVSVDFLLGNKPKMGLLELINSNHGLLFIIHCYLSVSTPNKNKILEYVNYVYSFENKHINIKLLNDFLRAMGKEEVTEEEIRQFDEQNLKQS